MPHPVENSGQVNSPGIVRKSSFLFVMLYCLIRETMHIQLSEKKTDSKQTFETLQMVLRSSF